MLVKASITTEATLVSGERLGAVWIPHHDDCPALNHIAGRICDFCGGTELREPPGGPPAMGSRPRFE